MRNLFKTGCWTAAIAGFLFLGADLHAQNRAVARTSGVNHNLYRQQALARPFIPQRSAAFNPALRNNAFGNFYRNGFYNPYVNSYGGFGNFNQGGGFYNPYQTPYYNPYQTGFNNPYLTGYSNPYLTGYSNPFLGYSNFNQTGYYNPYAYPGFTTPGFPSPAFVGY